ncbi:MAG: imidazole glycerol phosphate synthase subunit HisH [Gammaproteobacteria bacterium]|nr:imidazole glycerol phosphate synthase subunit HisH [Gammaproteobacteria bacterium]
MIKIVDYGLGNVRAFLNVYKRLDIPAAVARTAADLGGASRVVLPGVGAFDHAMELLQQSGMRETLDDLVLSCNVPVLGVCVGMQILVESSEEGQASGLCWINGSVRKLRAADEHQRLRLPHMGWNDVEPVGSFKLFDGLEKDARFYFLHSYHFDCEAREQVLAETGYGTRFVCAVRSGNIYGVQFHPEKSHQYGTRLLKNFAEV